MTSWSARAWRVLVSAWTETLPLAIRASENQSETPARAALRVRIYRILQNVLLGVRIDRARTVVFISVTHSLSSRQLEKLCIFFDKKKHNFSSCRGAQPEWVTEMKTTFAAEPGPTSPKVTSLRRTVQNVPSSWYFSWHQSKISLKNTMKWRVKSVATWPNGKLAKENTRVK